MKSSFLLTIFHLPLVLFCQETIQEPWKSGFGASPIIFLKTIPGINMRCISPSFKFSNENLKEEEEEKKTKDFRLAFELLYVPPSKILGTAIKMQYSVIKKEKISMEAYIGPKLFFIVGPDFINTKRFQKSKNRWYYSLGIILQAHLGVASPFFDIGKDGTVTIGTELNFHAIYKQPKRRYKLRQRELKPYE